MKIKVLESLCNGCGICVSKCPVNVIELNNKKAFITDGCTFCGICISVCPKKAIVKSLDDETISQVDGDCWVMIERRGNGTIETTSFEIISKIRVLKPEAKIIAILPTDNFSTEELDSFKKIGADKVVVLKNRKLKEYNPIVYSGVLSSYCRTKKPSLFLFPATEMGRDLAPRIATELETGLTADCTELSISEENGLLIQTRPAWDGNLMASIICPLKRPQMATIRPHAFPFIEHKKECILELIDVDVKTTSFVTISSRSKIKSFFPDLEKQTIIVGVGRGIGTKENIDLIFKFTQDIKAGIGCSRPIVDKGWLPHEVQIGMSGKAVAPKVYIALGISGSIQHLVGMQNSEYIIAVNKDGNAPIFQHSHLSLVGDIKKLLPRIREIVEKKKKEG
ncbi:MAG: electron transfer flavoprotein subunit alpha [Caldisericia bacterium]|nr:electron transfer flavoprotein subunit alpha [Caldisericia bacterium]